MKKFKKFKKFRNLKKFCSGISVLFLCLCTGILLTGCADILLDEILSESGQMDSVIEVATLPESGTETIPDTETIPESESIQETENFYQDSENLPDSQISPESPDLSESQEFEISEDETLPASVEKDGSYTTPEDVAEYIHTFGTLPGNFLTKKEAQALGWDSSRGNLWDVAPDCSIGGDYFGNYEGILPDGNYHECDVNYTGGYRGAERIIYSDDGRIYYTNDHYKSFEQLY